MDMPMLFTNLLAIAIPIVLAIVIKRSARQPLWAEAYRRLRRNGIAMLAFCIICVYGGIAVCDSIQWKLDSRCRPSRSSILDRATARITVERTYSAPFGTKTVEPKPHPVIGRHSMGTDASGKDVFVRTLKGCRTALIVGGAPNAADHSPAWRPARHVRGLLRQEGG